MYATFHRGRGSARHGLDHVGIEDGADFGQIQRAAHQRYRFGLLRAATPPAIRHLDAIKRHAQALHFFVRQLSQREAGVGQTRKRALRIMAHTREQQTERGKVVVVHELQRRVLDVEIKLDLRTEPCVFPFGLLGRNEVIHDVGALEQDRVRFAD